MELKDLIRARLARLAPRMLEEGYQGEAAVLIPVFEEKGRPHFLLTLRTEEVRTHKGQISFPGGMRNGSEDLQETALRETREEVGIPREQIEVLGRFHDYLAITNYRVVPYAGFVRQPFSAVPQRSEVAEILKVPFELFADPSRLRTERMLRLGSMIDVYFYRYGTREIWGLTARIIKEFIEALGWREGGISGKRRESSVRD
jgi:8-oxo-dGTP pyrophosphatase MutT (NUDIX family)